MKKLTAASVLGAALLSLTACGGSGSSSSTDAASSTRSAQDVKASKSISASIMKGQKAATGSSQLFTMSQKDADCIGNGLVDKIGVEQLQTYKLLDKNLKTRNSVTNAKMSAKDAESASSVLFGCTDVQGMMKKAISKSGNLPPAMKPCVDKTQPRGRRDTGWAHHVRSLRPVVATGQLATVATTRERVGGSAQARAVRTSLRPDHTRKGTASSTGPNGEACATMLNISPVNVVLSASRVE